MERNIQTSKVMEIFNNEDFGQVRVLIINDEPYFVGKDVANSLGYGGGNIKSRALTNAIKDHVDEEDKILLSYEDFKEYQNGDLKNISHYGAYVINESGLYSLILSSKLEGAKRFKRWITSEVLPSIRNKGSYDAIDNSLDLIKDETEKLLKKGIYQLEKVLEIMPNDIVTSIHLSQKRNELDTYLQSKKLAEINAQLEKQTRILTEQGQKLETTEQRVNNFMTIGDRQSFVREVNSVARATGKRQTEIYRLVYNTLKDMYGIDLYARARNYRENMQDKRIAEGKKPYSESTLNQKCSCLAIAEEKELFPQLGKALFSVRDSLLKEKKQK